MEQYVHPISTEFKQHPLSAAWPRMARAEFKGLVEDIRANGQTEPAVLLDGMVLDGWNRYLACLEAQVPFVTKSIDPAKDPVVYVLSLNRNRRHCTPGQNAVAVARCLEWRPRGAPQARNIPPFGGFDCQKKVDQPVVSTDEMAKLAGVSERTLERAKVVVSAGLADKVRDGEMSIGKAIETATAKPDVGKVASDAIEKARKPRDSELEKLKARIAELETELEAARENLQVMADELEAARMSMDPDVVEKIKAMKVYQRTVERQRDDHLRENAALKREVKNLQRRLGG